MRLLLALVLPLPVPALAAGWSHYANARYGYTLEVPAGFLAQREADNGDGQVFGTPTATLTVYGANVTAAGFESEVAARERDLEQDRWTITYAVSTPQKASFSGRRGARIVYVRMIALCGGAQLAAFALEYSVADLQKFTPVLDRLVASLKPTAGRC